MKKFKNIVIIIAILTISLSHPVGLHALSADKTANPTGGMAPKPLLNPPLGNGTDGGSDLKTIFLNVMDVVQTILIMVTTLYLIYAGFMFVTAKGDPGKIKKARDALLWGLVGAALILSAEVLAYGIGDTVKEVFKGK